VGPDKQASLMFGLGMNNNGTGLVLASLALADHPKVMIPIILYNLVQHVFAGYVHLTRIRDFCHRAVPEGGWLSGKEPDSAPNGSASHRRDLGAAGPRGAEVEPNEESGFATPLDLGEERVSMIV
jgi:hypothetical protein